MNVLLIGFVIIKIASDSSVAEEIVDLCSNSSDYETYTKNITQNCGCANASTCVRKCCQKGYFLHHYEDPFENIFESTCIKNETNLFNVPIYNRREHVFNMTLNDNFLIGMLECGNEGWQYFKMNNSDIMEKFFIQQNGKLYYHYSKYKFYNNNRYCIDEQEGLTAFLCYTPESPNKSVARFVNSIGLIISMPFLLLTFLVFAVVPNTSIHRRSLMLYCLSLFLAYAFLVTVQLSRGAFENFTCQTIGYLIIFFFMVSFFWMNVMCLDTWFAFGGLSKFTREQHSEKRRFIIYCVYACGLPLIHILIIFFINTFGNPNSPYYPGVGRTKCFLDDNLQTSFVYFYGPLTVIIGLNIVLFLLTSIKISKINKDALSFRSWTNKRRSYEYDKRKFHLYLKLLLAMGINWSLEIVSWAVQQRMDEREAYSKIFFIWYISDFCNAIYGLIIFLIFVYRKTVWKSFKKRLFVLITPGCNKSYELTEISKEVGSESISTNKNISF